MPGLTETLINTTSEGLKVGQIVTLKYQFEYLDEFDLKGEIQRVFIFGGVGLPNEEKVTVLWQKKRKTLLAHYKSTMVCIPDIKFFIRHALDK